MKLGRVTVNMRTDLRWLRPRFLAVIALGALALAFQACIADVGPTGEWARPIEEQGYVYFAGGNDGNIVRVDASTGQIDSWMYPRVGATGVGIIYGTPATDETSIYAAGYNCNLDDVCNAQVVRIATDGNSAEVVWNRGVAGTINGQLALAGEGAGALLLVGTGTRRVEGGGVIAIDPEGGNEEWRLMADGDVWGGVTVADDGVGYFGTLTGTLYAINLDRDFGGSPTQRILWQFNAGAPIVSPPSVANGKVYFGTLSNDNNLFQLDVATRAAAQDPDAQLSPTSEWAVDLGAWIWAKPLLVDDQLIITNIDGEVFPVETATGGEVWAQRASLSGSILVDSPVIDASGQRLFVSSYDEDVFLVDAASGIVDGATFATNSGVAAAPLLVNGRLYVHNLDGELQIFDPVSLVRQACVEIGDLGESC